MSSCTNNVSGVASSRPSSGLKGAGHIAPPSFIEWKGLRFLVLDAPRPSNLHLYLKLFVEHNVTDLVCVCERTYDTEEAYVSAAATNHTILVQCNPNEQVKNAGIKVHDMEYDDGSAPPEEVIFKWLKVVDIALGESEKGWDTSLTDGGNSVAVHCVAGLGRAPVLVAIALIEHGMDPVDAVDYIRKRRRGAINAKQLAYLIKYTPKARGESSCCIIS